jgi:hypothetical protein
MMADGELRVVKIQEVNPSQYTIIGIDPYGSLIQITWHFHDTIIAVPVVGESWLIERYGNDWFLDRRSETSDVTTPVTDLQPGDRRLEASGTLYLNVEKIMVNGQTLKDWLASQ